MGVADHIAAVVPAEFGHAGVAEPAHQQLFALVQGVQAHEHELAHVREAFRHHIGGRAVPQAFGELPVDLPFV